MGIRRQAPDLLKTTEVRQKVCTELRAKCVIGSLHIYVDFTLYRKETTRVLACVIQTIVKVVACRQITF